MNADIIAQALALSDERDQRHKFAYDLARDAYAAGYADGLADEQRRADREWAAMPVPVPRAPETIAELDARRWGPGGRERFADPRPGDYPGQRAGHGTAAAA